MDCRTAQMLIDLGCARQPSRELEAADAQLLDGHLGQCPDCRIHAGAEQQLDAQFAQLSKALPALVLPLGLRERLLTRLAAERFAFYRWWTVRIGLGVGLLAAIIVGCYLWLKPTPEKVPPLFTLSTFRPVERELLPTTWPELVNWFYSQHGIYSETPTELELWDLGLLVQRYVRSEFGQQVPTLVFRKDHSWAVVSLLRREQYTEDSLQSFEGPNRRVLGRPYRDSSIALVVLHAGAYEDFLKNPPAKP